MCTLFGSARIKSARKMLMKSTAAFSSILGSSSQRNGLVFSLNWALKVKLKWEKRDKWRNSAFKTKIKLFAAASNCASKTIFQNVYFLILDHSGYFSFEICSKERRFYKKRWIYTFRLVLCFLQHYIALWKLA